MAQVREPYTAVGYLARRVPLVSMLQLVHPDDTCPVPKKTSGRRVGDFELDGVSVGGACGASRVTKNEPVWTAWDICDGKYFILRNYNEIACRQHMRLHLFITRKCDVCVCTKKN